LEVHRKSEPLEIMSSFFSCVFCAFLRLTIPVLRLKDPVRPWVCGSRHTIGGSMVIVRTALVRVHDNVPHLLGGFGDLTGQFIDKSIDNTSRRKLASTHAAQRIKPTNPSAPIPP